MSNLFAEALSLVQDLTLEVGPIKRKGRVTFAPVTLRSPFGSITFRLVAGALGSSVDRYEQPPPLRIFSKAVQSALKAFEEIVQGQRIAVYGIRREDRRYVLELMILSGDSGEAIISLELHDHHFNRTEAEGFLSAQQLAGLHRRVHWRNSAPR